jgi:branched-chain amino acid transport system ATP-binding protein
MKALMQLDNISIRFGGVQALDSVSFDVQQGELLSLIGPNGAGKTTLLKCITGIVKPQPAARITLSGREISQLQIHQRMRLGLAMTNQIVHPFRSMSVLDNVTLAAGHRRVRNILVAMVSFDRRQERQQALALLTRVGIADSAAKPVAGQPLGVLKRLEMARALALSPKLLLLDEPLAGLNNIEAARLADTVRQLNEQGITIVMIEHNLGEVLRISQRMVVLDNGCKIAEGDPKQVMQDPAVRSAYIGREKNHAAS